jgi:hypothetical protein
MNPERWLIGELGPKRGTEHKKPADQTDEDSRSVAGIREGEIEPAYVAGFRDIEKAGESFASSAAWTAAEEACPIGRLRRVIGIKAHGFISIGFTESKGAALGHPL